jgi:hypothetical protein
MKGLDITPWWERLYRRYFETARQRRRRRARERLKYWRRQTGWPITAPAAPASPPDRGAR